MSVSRSHFYGFFFLTPIAQKGQEKGDTLAQYGRLPKIPKVCRSEEQKRSLAGEGGVYVSGQNVVVVNLQLWAQVRQEL